MWSLLKTIVNFASAYKLIIGIVAAAGMVITILTYVHNYGQMKAQIVDFERTVQQCHALQEACLRGVESRNQRIAEINMLMEKELAEANARIAAANEAAAELRADRDRITEELAVTRFELLEAIRDDEDFADWVDTDVPVAAWSLLQQAREGN